MHPKLESICPTDPLVPLAKLGLSPQSRLLVVAETLESIWDEKSNGLYIVAPEKATPEQAASFFEPRQTNSRVYRASPNSIWVVFQRRVQGTEHGTPWISSIDGKQQWSLSSDPRFEDAIWLDDSNLLLIDESGTLYQVLNPFTMQVESLDNLPPRQVDGIGAQFFRSAGHTYMIYQAGQDYRLFEADTQKDQSILSWLRDDKASFLDKGVTVQPGGRIVVRVDRPYGFDISPAMTVDELVASKNFAETMRPIVLPPAIMPVYATSGYARDNSGLILVGGPTNDHTYWLDLQQGVIKDYCFEKGNPAEVSPDNRFIVFQHESLPHVQPIPKAILVLNLDTGNYSQIDHYGFMAWMESDS